MPVSRRRRARPISAIPIGVLGATAGGALWITSVSVSGQYRAFLAPLVALGVAIAMRVWRAQGRRAQALGLLITLVGVAFGQYLCVGLKTHHDVTAQGLALTARPPWIPIGLFWEAWAELRDPVREMIYLGVCLALPVWMLGRRKPASGGIQVDKRED